jgi:folate-binding protein YgfZ
MPCSAPAGETTPPFSAAWERLHLAVVTATGPDAVRFVDNFATAAISMLEVGQGTETFFADARGQVLALATVLRTATGLVIVAAPGVGPLLRDHLERYHIRESLTLADASADVATFLLTGTAAAARLAELGCGELPQADAAHAEHMLTGIPVRIIRVTGRGADGFWLQSAAGLGDQLATALTAAHLPQTEADELEAARIEAGFPLPADIVERTLPQELGRDARAISLNKGCYLGQETVARLDAMGHVNRRLAVVALERDHPPDLPARVLMDDQPVGLLTSAAYSHRLGCTVGLAIIQTRGLAGSSLRVAAVPAWIVSIAGHPELESHP